MNPSNKKAFNALTRNPSAIFGLSVIFLAALISIFSYVLMPDQSTNANDGILSIRKKSMGFSTDILRITKNSTPKDGNIISNMFFGKNLNYRSIAIDEYTFDDKGFVNVFIQGTNQTIAERIALVDIAFALSPNKKWVLNKDNIEYYDIQENKHSISSNALKAIIQEQYIVNKTYILGTDGAGRDLFSRLLLGSRISLSIGFVAVLISISIGTFLGAIAGYYKGKIDQFIMWFTTVFWSIPGIMLVIAISMALQSKGIWVTFLAVGMTTWVETARVVRGQVMEMREKQFIEAAQALGYSDSRIIFKHILPNITAPLIVIATSNFASAILIEAGLSFLGLGVQPPTPSWGMMVNEGYTLLTSSNSWHLLVLPSACISILVLAFNLFGNALRDAFDPKNIMN